MTDNFDFLCYVWKSKMLELNIYIILIQTSFSVNLNAVIGSLFCGIAISLLQWKILKYSKLILYNDILVVKKLFKLQFMSFLFPVIYSNKTT